MVTSDRTAHPQFAAIGNSRPPSWDRRAGRHGDAAFATLRRQAYAAVATLGLLAGSQYYNESGRSCR